MVAVTDRAGDGDRPAEGPAAVGRAGEPDAVAADPGHIDIVAVDGLLSLRVLARATLADLGNRPDVRPVPAAGGMPHSGSTGRRDGGRDRGCKCYTEDDQAPQNAPGMPAVNCPSKGRGDMAPHLLPESHRIGTPGSQARYCPVSIQPRAPRQSGHPQAPNSARYGRPDLIIGDARPARAGTSGSAAAPAARARAPARRHGKHAGNRRQHAGKKCGAGSRSSSPVRIAPPTPLCSAGGPCATSLCSAGGLALPAAQISERGPGPRATRRAPHTA